MQVIAGSFEGCTAVVAKPVEDSDQLVTVIVDVLGRGTPVLLRDHELGPADGDGRGGVREPTTPNRPSDTHAAALELSHPHSETK